jgi:hypothetical protein
LSSSKDVADAIVFRQKCANENRKRMGKYAENFQKNFYYKKNFFVINRFKTDTD